MPTAQKTHAQAHTRTSKPALFVERIQHTGGSGLHVIKTYDSAQRPCWFLLKADELSLMKLERTRHDDMIDLTHYGEVVASGWGHTPDAAA